MAAAPKLYYWGIKARGQLPVILAAFAQQPLDWEKNPDWPGLKAETNFGQLPYLVDNGLKINQSMAIARYLSRKYGLQGDSDADFAISEQLIEETVDIFTAVAKANYSPEKAAAYTAVFETDVPKHFGFLEALLPSASGFASKITTGDLAVFSVINILLDLEPTVVDNFPKLKAFYAGLSENAGIKSYLDQNIPAYFKRD
eukprot:CAMPEP_0184652400 /NCGR_PEP_ID=MMETSP0308-20130426/10088_1 /TAXON_ID=38269 /ORGANISM="Gloeochaete witrockiana, Strain SAG 46.84" /LENGTH=199 /DNA_ID=CAMNT_0027087243 /DNA_START=56 /DNA_END=655 /DNA_ORIENTATION=+